MVEFGKKHIVITDQQLKPGVESPQIEWISKYVVDKLPDVLVIIGDWADMPSLSSYDKDKIGYQQSSYQEDILAANDALQRLMGPIELEQQRRVRRRMKRWNLRKIVTLGNHENRINRAVAKDRTLKDTLSTDHLHFGQWGFEVYPFLQPVEVDGIAYCHYFPSGVRDNPIGTARGLLTKLHMSCFAGHQQGRDIAYGRKANGDPLTAIIAGSGYPHPEGYLSPMANKHWRGIYVLHDVINGSYDEMPVSLKFLQSRYG